ncbi:MAG: aldolase [Hyphomicrobium sp.]|nr:aldolase [Hyphomicrobium sp.]PPD09107.1 MAG: aldolase [Hyphomicrobium sp.]
MAPIGATEGVLLHGTAIALGDRAVLLRGPPGAGKSDLALRALAAPPGRFSEAAFELVGDDQVFVRRAGGRLIVNAHPRLAGLIEVRGLGILPVPYRAEAELVLVTDLVAGGDVERLPDPWPVTDVLGVPVPVMRLAPFEASAPLKLALALTQQPWVGVAN